jgi:hypothetical protein
VLRAKGKAGGGKVEATQEHYLGGRAIIEKPRRSKTFITPATGQSPGPRASIGSIFAEFAHLTKMALQPLRPRRNPAVRAAIERFSARHA